MEEKVSVEPKYRLNIPRPMKTISKTEGMSGFFGGYQLRDNRVRAIRFGCLNGALVIVKVDMQGWCEVSNSRTTQIDFR